MGTISSPLLLLSDCLEDTLGAWSFESREIFSSELLNGAVAAL
jgi:hypothetical protein